MDEQKVTPLIDESVAEAFQTTLNASPEILYFDNFDEMEEECVISSIGFAGTMEGSFSICLPDSSACALVGRMLSQDIQEVNIDVIDGIGEMVNMILGGVKMRLAGSDHNFDISIPTCIKGSRMVILSDVKKTHMITRSYKSDNIMFASTFMYKVENKKSDQEQAKLAALEKLKNLGG